MKFKKTIHLLSFTVIFFSLFSIEKITAQSAKEVQKAYAKEHADDAKYLKGFDEKAVITELKKKGIPESEYRGIIRFRKHEYIEKQKGTKAPLPYFSKQDPSKLRTASGCPNANFEDTTFTNWSAGHGTLSLNWPTTAVTWTAGFISGPINDVASDPNSRQDLLTDPAGFDPVAINTVTGVPAIPYLAPGGGHVSVRLGNEYNGSGTEYLKYPITVTPTNTSFTYQYAVVLQNPTGHTANEQPRFTIKLFNQAGTQVTGPCGAYDVQALGAATDPTFFPFGVPSGSSSGGSPWADGGYYKPWTTVTIDLSAYVNQTMTIWFITQDCTLGGHFGYAYIDATCSQLENQVLFCPTDTMVAIVAPPGFNTYQWTNDSTGLTIPAPLGTGETLYVHKPHLTLGNQYSVVMSTVAGCGSSLTSTLAYSNLTLYHNINNVTCNGVNDGLAYINQSGAQGPFTYTWIDSASSANVTPTVNPDSLTNAHPGTYYVTVTTSGGCFSKDTIHITQPPPLPATHIGTPFCPQDSQVTLTAPSGTNYQWYAGSSSSGTVVGTASTYVVTSPVLGQAYTVNYKPSGGGCANAIIDTLYYSQISVTSQPSSPATCYGLANGQEIVTVTGLLPPFTYSWSDGVNPPTTTTTDTLHAGAGTYTVTVSTPGGCTNTATFSISQPPPSPPSHIGTPICPQDAQVTLAAPDLTGNNYQWYDITGTLIPAPTGTVSNYVAASPTIGQVYTVSYTPSGATCLVTVKDSFYLYHLNKPPFTSNNATCYGYSDGSASITQPISVPAGASGPFTYNWVYNSSSVATTTSAANLFAGTYYVTATSAGGCVSGDTIVIGQQPNGFDSLKLTTKYCPGDSPITIHAPAGYSSYAWYANANASGTVISTADSLVVVNPIVGTQYTVEMPNPTTGACNIIINATLDYSAPPPAPNFITNINVFTPNGDGKNDYFLMNQSSYKFIKDFHLEVYNRWGKKVFETNDFTSQWDGKIDGHTAVEGVYYWISNYTQACLVNAPTITSTGFVQIIR